MGTIAKLWTRPADRMDGTSLRLMTGVLRRREKTQKCTGKRLRRQQFRWSRLATEGAGKRPRIFVGVSNIDQQARNLGGHIDSITASDSASNGD
jgi:hypothetical protein